eukprot:gene4555-biopygen2623
MRRISPRYSSSCTPSSAVTAVIESEEPLISGTVAGRRKGCGDAVGRAVVARLPTTGRADGGRDPAGEQVRSATRFRIAAAAATATPAVRIR